LNISWSHHHVKSNAHANGNFVFYEVICMFYSRNIPVFLALRQNSMPAFFALKNFSMPYNYYLVNLIILLFGGLAIQAKRSD